MRPLVRSLAVLVSVVPWLAAPRAAVAQAGTVVVLVRHAEKDTAPGPDPVLSEPGVRRSAVLATRPEVAGATAAFATQFRRTQQTAAPLAERRHFATTVVPIAGDVAVYAAHLAETLRARPAGDTVLVVGHSNTIAPIAAALGAPRMTDLADAEYSRLFVVTLAADGTATLREVAYGTPTGATAHAPAAMPVGAAAAGAMTPPAR